VPQHIQKQYKKPHKSKEDDTWIHMIDWSQQSHTIMQSCFSEYAIKIEWFRFDLGILGNKH